MWGLWVQQGPNNLDLVRGNNGSRTGSALTTIISAKISAQVADYPLGTYFTLAAGSFTLGTSPFTFGFVGAPSGNDHFVLGYGDKITGKGPHIGTGGSGGWRFGTWAGDIDGGTATVGEIKWIVGTYDGTTMRLYENAIQVGGRIQAIVAGTTFPGQVGGLFDLGNTRTWQSPLLYAFSANWHWPPALVEENFSPDTRWDLIYELGRRTFYTVPAVGGPSSFPAAIATGL